MRRITHLVLGAAVTVPLALDQPVAVVIGCLAIGAVGGGVPDWIDFQTGLRRPFVPRHRGASHGLPVMIASLGVLMFVVLLVRDRQPGWLAEFGLLAGSGVWVLMVALGLGWLSHLMSDACTIGGIQPFLPFSRWRCWMLPRQLRSRSDGYLDKLVRLAALAILGFGIVIYVMGWWSGQ